VPTIQSYLSGSAPSPWYSVPLGTKALDVLRAAEKSAQEFGHHRVRTCHLLLALTEAEGRGLAALRRLGITWEAVHEEVARLQTPEESESKDNSAEGGTADGELCPSRRVEEIIEQAQEAAYNYGRGQTMPVDFLLALTKGRTGGTSDQVFERLGLPVTFVHNQVVRRRVEPREYEIERRIRHVDDLLTYRE
jgi:ATP-dependent Clp protease ATP-binding subunit ClpA